MKNFLAVVAGIFCLFIATSLAAVQPTATKSTFMLYARGGVNLATQSEISKSFANVSYTRLYLGLDAWYGLSNKLDLGLSVNRFDAFSRSDSTIDSKIQAYPVLLEARYYVFDGFYAGGGLGVGPAIFSYLGDNNTIWGAALGLRTGYDYSLTKRLLLGADVHMIYLMQNIKFSTSTSESNFGSVTKGASQANFLFSAHVGYKI